MSVIEGRQGLAQDPTLLPVPRGAGSHVQHSADSKGLEQVFILRVPGVSQEKEGQHLCDGCHLNGRLAVRRRQTASIVPIRQHVSWQTTATTFTAATTTTATTAAAGGVSVALAEGQESVRKLVEH